MNKITLSELHSIVFSQCFTIPDKTGGIKTYSDIACAGGPQALLLIGGKQ